MVDPLPVQEQKQQINGENVETPRKIDEVSALSDFESLQVGAQIEVTRLTPNPIKGYCGHMVVPEGGMSDVMEELKSSYGGGRYNLRAKSVSANGRVNYVKGSVHVDVAGFPRDGSKEWMNGMWRSIQFPAPLPQAVPVETPVARSLTPGLEGMMNQFLHSAVTGALSGENGISLKELPGLINAIAGLQRPEAGPERDPYNDLDRTMGLLDRLEKRRSPEAVVAATSPEESSGMESILGMLASKFLSPQAQQAPQPQPQPQPHPGYPQQPYPPQPPPNFPPYPPHASGQQMYENAHANAQRAGTHPQPPPMGNWTTDPRSAQSTEGVQPQEPPPPPQRSPEPPPPQTTPPTAAADPQVEYELLTADDFMADLASRDETSRTVFLDEILTKLGLDQILSQQLQAKSPVGPPESPDAIPLPGGPGAAFDHPVHE